MIEVSSCGITRNLVNFCYHQFVKLLSLVNIYNRFTTDKLNGEALDKLITSAVCCQLHHHYTLSTLLLHANYTLTR